ncbi:alkane 1-monooxygenase [Bacterioplanoides pacificum]|uniref:Alkane 1-monooxygenase n=1 Tax=Bacterioplanoides pacificum TaxID=1171596 RepID=A0ABV7VQS2_9GAMM
MKIFHYLKYFLFHFIGLAALAGITIGGPAVSYMVLAVLVIYILGDALAGDDTSTPEFNHPQILTFQLWLALPLLSAIMFASVWSVCDSDVLGYGALVQQLTGIDVLTARENTAIWHHFSAFIGSGLMIGLIGTITAHELTHRTWDPISMLIGRWLLAFSFDTIFSIEHVYGHHRYVSSKDDPATAPRGRNVYFHILASTVKGNISAWKIEKKRLQRKGYAVFGPRNAVIRGHLMSVLLVAIAYAMGGLVAAGYFLACMLWGKALLEIVNYMEHYGMVRNPETPVQPRHSWNTNKRISSWAMFNLTRHSHHHAQGEVPYQDLKPYPEAPMMISGYLTTIVIAMIPPLWHKLMIPKVLEWDAKYASDEELELIREANANSGIKAFEESVITDNALQAKTA